jgi:hypothetical protein
MLIGNTRRPKENRASDMSKYHFSTRDLTIHPCAAARVNEYPRFTKIYQDNDIEDKRELLVGKS